MHKILDDFGIQTDNPFQTGRPNLDIINKKEGTNDLVNFAVLITTNWKWKKAKNWKSCVTWRWRWYYSKLKDFE